MRKNILPHSSLIQNRIVPPVTYVKLKYTPMLASSSTPYRILTAVGSGSVFGYHTMAGNDVYDPDTTGTGGRPTGVKEWFGFYSQCTVLASKIKVTFVNQNSVGFWKVGVVPTKQGTAWVPSNQSPTDWPGSKSQVVTPYVANERVSMVNYYRTSTIFGVSAEEVKNDGDYDQGSASQPINQWFWMLYALPADASGGSGANISAEIEVVYYCMFKKRQDLAIS